jgi:hypothetical protein
VIRWEEQKNGNWDGFSGEVVISTVVRNPGNPGRWDWQVTGAGQTKGFRNAGHRTSEVEARRSAEAAWQKWLDATALKPDLMTLAEMSLPKRGRATSPKADESPAPATDHAAEIERLRAQAALADTKAKEEARRAETAEARSKAAEDKVAEIEAAVKDRLDRIREILDESAGPDD